LAEYVEFPDDWGGAGAVRRGAGAAVEGGGGTVDRRNGELPRRGNRHAVTRVLIHDDVAQVHVDRTVGAVEHDPSAIGVEVGIVHDQYRIAGGMVDSGRAARLEAENPAVLDVHRGCGDDVDTEQAGANALG